MTKSAAHAFIITTFLLGIFCKTAGATHFFTTLIMWLPETRPSHWICRKRSVCSACLICFRIFKGYSQRERTRLFIVSVSALSAQTKFSVRIENKKLVDTDRGGTHILKPTLLPYYENYQDAPANEHVTMLMARVLFKIPTALSALLYFKNGDPVYITKFQLYRV